LGCLILGIAGNALAAPEKPHIAVLHFNNNTQAYWWQAGTAIELQDMLTSELAATKAFHVVDRHELYLLFEQKFTEALLADPRTTKLKPGKIKGIRYFIAATVSAFEENTNGGGRAINFPGLFSANEQNKAYVVIDLKVIDREAGAIIDSRAIEGTSSGNILPGHPGNYSKFSGNLIKRERTPVGKAIRNSIIETTEYLECLLITKNKECVKKYEAIELKRKDRNKTAIQFQN
jgi:curli biogenesis system outer membrane secretion channel CsgG